VTNLVAANSGSTFSAGSDTIGEVHKWLSA